MRLILFFTFLLLTFNAYSLERATSTSQIGMSSLEVAVIAGTNATAQTIAPITVDNAGTATLTDIIATTTAHNFSLGDRVRFTGTGTPTVIGGTGANTDYFAIPVDADHLKIATSYALAVAGTQVDLTDTGTATLYLAINEFKELSHGFITGDHVKLTTTGTLPADLSASTDYWVIANSADRFTIASSLANAIAGTSVKWTDALTDDAGTQVTATQVEKLDGPAKLRFTLQCQSTGVYKLTLKDTGKYYSTSKMIAFTNTREADKFSWVSAYDQTYVTVSMKTIAASPAAVNGTFNLLLLGSNVSTFY